MKTVIFAASKKTSKVMKKVYSLFIMAACWFMISCSQTPGTSENINGAGIQFETTEHDFGTIPEKGDGTFAFVFKNTGKEPLILKNVRSSCGCTVPEWPKEPIKKVSYNTRITGSFTKSITVYSNAEGDPVVLRIKGKVEPAAN
jgi:hypothetical protein